MLRERRHGHHESKDEPVGHGVRGREHATQGEGDDQLPHHGERRASEDEPRDDEHPDDEADVEAGEDRERRQEPQLCSAARRELHVACGLDEQPEEKGNSGIALHPHGEEPRRAEAVRDGDGRSGGRRRSERPGKPARQLVGRAEGQEEDERQRRVVRRSEAPEDDAERQDDNEPERVKPVRDGRSVVGELSESDELVGDDRVVKVVILEEPQERSRVVRQVIEKRRTHEGSRAVRGGPAKEPGVLGQPLRERHEATLQGGDDTADISAKIGIAAPADTRLKRFVLGLYDAGRARSAFTCSGRKPRPTMRAGMRRRRGDHAQELHERPRRLHGLRRAGPVR